MPKERRGDFLVPNEDIEAAEAVFTERSPRSQAIDRAHRAPITTDIETYRRSGGRGVDFPGVDTPTEDPKASVLDPVNDAMQPAEERFADSLGFAGKEMQAQAEAAGETLRSLL